MSDFVHLHCHSTFSPLDGVATPFEYFEECGKRGYIAHAITEHGNMASVPDSYWASKEFGVKYIPGCELYYNDYEEKRRELESKGIKVRSMEDGIEKSRMTKQRHVTVLCKSMSGYRNLLSIRKKSYDFIYFKPRANIRLLNEHKEGLIILSGCYNGPLSFEVRSFLETEDEKYWQKAIKTAKMFKMTFRDDFYIELQMPGIENDVKLFSKLHELANELKIKTVITNDAHYIKENDYNLQRIMMSIDQDLPFNSDGLFISKSTSGYFKTRDELRETFKNGHVIGDEKLPSYNEEVSIKDFEKACDATLEIAEKCEEFNPDTSTKLPIIKNEEKELLKLVAIGLKEKGLENNKTYKDRIKFEMSRIIDKEFCSYFLICRDLVRKSTVDLGMPVGPRGSAGGSLVCYLIGIHEIDPIEWDLSFDRFLSSSRGGKMLRVDLESDDLESDDLESDDSDEI